MKTIRRQQVAGKAVAITGGARGIGLATARAARDRGARVVIGDLDPVAAEKAGADLGIAALPLDVTDRGSFAGFLDAAEDLVGPVDVLVNNAGIMPLGRVETVGDTEATRCIDVNLHGVMLGTKIALLRMIPRGHGQIINIASIAGVTPAPGMALYNASKAAVLAFTDATRLEVRDRGIQVGAMLPSFTNTELISGTRTPKGQRALEPDEVAAGVIAMIERPSPRRTVPRSLGVSMRLAALYPDRLTRALYHLLDVDTVFLDYDHSARAAYAARIHDGSAAAGE
ncbi:SDR family oxidoreductase [Nocardia yunnanensis]|uniref:SDR family oxidoreductase n=1 Tax=Nocardia yunnanensis TaxID=2382165 RepID=A0A386ZQD5_9NOCA|nr:SDR family oxidoreductase [Nocardia yunnanensis]AYF79404.1 SDR family oxidoreductase [Nocardia yunnanensis]